MRTLWRVSVLLLVACGKGNGLQTVTPSLEITPAALHFPLTAFGASAQQTVTLQALSSADVQVQLALSGGSAAAYSLSPSGAVTVPGEQSAVITVTFAPVLPMPIPTDESFNASLTVTSNDPSHASTTLAITGSAQAPELDLCWTPPATDAGVCLSQGPLSIPFGTVAPLQTPAPIEVDLENLAQVPLTVSQLGIDDAGQAAGFGIEETVALPLTLSAQTGLSEVFHVTFKPNTSGPAEGHLIAVSDDPRAAGQPVDVSLTAIVQAFQPPTACLGIAEIDYIDGTTAAVSPDQPLASQPAIVPPGPLDSVLLTAEVSSTCSSDPQDGQNLGYAFALAPPAGSLASLASVTGETWEKRVQFDLAGNYQAQVTVTDSASLTANASLSIPVEPQQDLSASLTWTGLNQVDLDLHLVRQTGDAGSLAALVDDPLNDCFWCNCLLATNYSGGSPCDSQNGPQFPTSLQWGSAGSSLAGNPLLVASQRFLPLPSENLDNVRLTGPQAGDTYGLYVHYYQAYQSLQGATCTADSDCTDPVYASCVGGECLPITTADLRVFVGSQDLLDGGPPLSAPLRHPCDLWYAGSVAWISGGHLVDGGYATPVYVFQPAADGGSVVSNGQPTNLVCDTL